MLGYNENKNEKNKYIYNNIFTHLKIQYKRKITFFYKNMH